MIAPPGRIHASCGTVEASAQSNQFIHRLIPDGGAKPGPLLDRPRKIACDYIRERTQPGNITSTALASVEDFDLDSAALRSLDYRVLLQELRASGHIFVFPAYRYTPTAKSGDQEGLQPVRYLLARTDNLALLHDIFEELVQASVNTILAWQTGSTKDAAEELHRILEAPGPNQKTAASEIVFSPAGTRAAFVQNDTHGLAPPDWLIQEFFSSLRSSLGAKGAAVLLPGDRFIPVNDAQILPCFRVCATYLQKAAEALAKQDAQFAVKAAALHKEEQSYARKPYSGPVLDYDIRRATAVLAAVEGRNQTSGAGLELPARFMLALRSRAAELQKREWQEYCARFVADFLSGLQKESDDWSKQLRFFSMQSRQSIHPAIWPLLRHHPALVSERWETETGTCFVFCSRRPEDLGRLLESVSLDPNCETWRLQALASIIADSEHFDLLMESPNLRRRHAELVRRATKGTIPTPVRWLFYLPSFLHRTPRNMSRTRTAARQAALADRNRRRQSRRSPLEIETVRRRPTDPGVEKQLLHLLEDTYFTKKQIPTIGDLHRNFPELQAGEFARLLRRHGFQLLPADDSGRITRGSVVLFADDASLPVYSGRIRDLIRRVREPDQIERAKRLDAHLARSSRRRNGAPV
ncbi:MAG: hypothetical protein NXI24_18900 [bacterium]|nr:hypothetical protein [bacterium]